MEYKNWTIEGLQKLEDPKNKGAFIAEMKFTKNGEERIRAFHGLVSQEGLKQAVTGWIDTLESAKAATLEIDFTEPVVAEPVKTADEIAKEEWQKDRDKLRQVMELVRDGVLPADDIKVAALQNKVRTGFKLAYLE